MNWQSNTSSLRDYQLGAARMDVAQSLVGRTVSLMVDARHITKGIVAGVLLESGLPKIVVNGSSYDPGQVLSSRPTFLTV